MSKTFLFQTIQLSVSTHFSSIWPIDRTYQVLLLLLRGTVCLGAMAIKRYSAFPQSPALLKPHHQIVLCHIRIFFGGVWLLCWDAVDVFCSPSRLGHLGGVLPLCWDAFDVFCSCPSVPSRLGHIVSIKYSWYKWVIVIGYQVYQTNTNNFSNKSIWS